MRYNSIIGQLAFCGNVIFAQQCSTVVFNLTVTSQNTVFASPPDPASETDIIQFTLASLNGTPPATSGTTTVTGTFTITGTYCTPTAAAKDVLQVLVHGITYGRSYWSGFGVNPINNWHLAANARGYATLAIDRLGHGDSPQRPDPLTVVQPQMQVEILHQILNAVRTQTPPSPVNPLGGGYSKLVPVGHSYGSVVVTTAAQQFPADTDALVLMAYSSSLNFTRLVEASWAAIEHHAPASSNTLLGYITLASEADRTAGFYSGSFDPALPLVDFRLEDSFTAGEAADILSLLMPTQNYGKPVFVATGAQDALLCDTTVEGCEAKLAQTRLDFFPGLDEGMYGFVAPDHTGHSVHLHLSAPQTYKAVHDFLDSKLQFGWRSTGISSGFCPENYCQGHCFGKGWPLEYVGLEQ